MFGLGPLEILVILAAFVIFVGPDKIPEVTRQVAKFFVQAKRMSSDVKNVVDDAIRDAEREIEVKEIKHLISDLDVKAKDEEYEQDCESRSNSESSQLDVDSDGSEEENRSDADGDKETINEDGIPNSSIDMNSSISRSDPFGEDDEDVGEDQEKKSE